MGDAERRAVISVSDKEGVVEFAKALKELGFHIISTGGTARVLESAGIDVERVEHLTGFPEILGGRVKTLHPKVHAGILARDLPEDREQIERLGIKLISLVAVNLYPFRETVARRGVTLDEAIENIDIGGPALVRAAAKNYERVAVVVNPERYDQILRELREEGEVTLKTRFQLAREAFWHTALYDAAIAAYLYSVDPFGEGGLERRDSPQRFPSRLLLPLVKISDLRYGENPHQGGAFYREETGVPFGVAASHQHQGKELSYNNILDLDAALRLVSEFKDPAAAVIKHSTPSGVACSLSLVEAFRRARDADPVAAYGGIVGLNKRVDRETAEALIETFFEAVIAPAYSEDALSVLSSRKNLRVLSCGVLGGLEGWLDAKRVSGGFLLQDVDQSERDLEELRSRSRAVTRRAPTDSQWEDLFFAWTVVKHVYSNAIVVAKGRKTLGIGGGQVSRIDAARIALEKAGDEARGAVLASDGFLPFADTVELAASCGVTALIQPGGSVRDEEVIAAADRAGIAMVFTGRRHFRH